MQKSRRIVAACIVLIWTAVGVAYGHGEQASEKIGILLAAFGSSEPAAQAVFEQFEKEVKQVFPDVPVRWAFTSHMIREKMRRQNNQLDSPALALAKMMEDRFTHVVVQSLHTILGAEYHDLQRTVAAFESMGGFRKIVMGDALMATQEDMERIVAAVLKSYPGPRKADEALVLMGHGTHHASNAFYAALMFQLQCKDPNIFVGTVEGYPDIDVIQTMMLEKKIGKAYLAPLMSIAGDHAVNDMAGDGGDSWKTVLGRAGIQCAPILRGTAEYPAFAGIWISHIGAAVGQLKLR